MTILDPGGITVLIGIDTIQAVAQSTNEKSAANFPDQPGHYDEEVFVDPLNWMFILTPSGDIVGDLHYSTMYNQFQDVYMSRLGITGDWRSRLESVNLPLSTDADIHASTTQLLEPLRQSLNALLQRRWGWQR